MDKQENQHLLDLPRIIAVGVASPAGAALTSRFGVAGTLVGLALSAVIIAVVSDLLKAYLQRLPTAVTTIAGRSRKKEAGRRSADRSRSSFYKLASLPPAQRRSALIRWVVGIGLAFIIGLGVVTAVEASVGKNLSCWLWNNCPTAASSTAGEGSNTSTLPSILGGGQSPNSNTPSAQVRPLAPPQPGQQPASPSASQAPTQSSSSGSGQPSSSSSGQQQSSSGGYQQQGGQSSSSSSSQQQSPSGEYGHQGEHEQTTEEYQQQSPSSSSEYQQQKDIQSTAKPGGQHQQAQQKQTSAPLYSFTMRSAAKRGLAGE